MVMAAARISPRLHAALARLDEETLPIAEVYRRFGAEADRLALPRPSYERVRVLVHELRAAKQPEPGYGEVLFDIATRTRPARAIYDDPSTHRRN
jgi:hypothetical protein